jgi:hypothetical protein
MSRLFSSSDWTANTRGAFPALATDVEIVLDSITESPIIDLKERATLQAAIEFLDAALKGRQLVRTGTCGLVSDALEAYMFTSLRLHDSTSHADLGSSLELAKRTLGLLLSGKENAKPEDLRQTRELFQRLGDPGEWDSEYTP